MRVERDRANALLEAAKSITRELLIDVLPKYGTIPGTVDLQREVHEDMLQAFDAYPRDWGLSRPDRNIDHRRVPNLETYFARQGVELPATQSAADYQPGDLVTWRLNHRLPHIGIVSDRSSEAGRRMIIHNIGEGPKEEDVLFAYPVHRHFRPKAGDPASTE